MQTGSQNRANVQDFLQPGNPCRGFYEILPVT